MQKTLLVLSLSASALLAGYSEHAYLYKDARIMGMGGANVAVGGYSTALFHNPAGLKTIKKSHGLEVELLGFNLSGSSKIQEFVSDLNDAGGDTSAISNVLEKYSGDHFNANVGDYSSVSYNGGEYAWSVGLLMNADVNLIPHGNGGTNDLLETHSRVYGGITAGVAKSYENIGPGTLDVGVGLKYISQKSYEAGLTVTELANNQDDLGQYLQDKYEKESSGIGLDLGVVYKLFPENYWHPSFGLSILNIGGMGMDDQYGKQPMTVNLGASIRPELPFFEHFIVAVDYVDLFNANETRFYNFTDAGGTTEISYTDYSESDFMKRLRLGVSAGLIDNSWFLATVNAGLYQSNYTLGVDLQASVVKFSFATYAEEIGPEAGELTDRRYMAYLGLGW